jgi:hypothetical protein
MNIEEWIRSSLHWWIVFGKVMNLYLFKGVKYLGQVREY